MKSEQQQILDRLEAIEKSLDAIRKRVDNIDIVRQLPAPLPPTPNTWFDPKTCPKCGLKLEGVMGYCCPQPYCPTGMGPVMCTTNGNA